MKFFNKESKLDDTKVASDSASHSSRSDVHDGTDEKTTIAALTANLQPSSHDDPEMPAAEKQPNVDVDAHADDDDVEYPKAMKLALITIALCLSVFCMALDNTIISTAIPKITDQFKVYNFAPTFIRASTDITAVHRRCRLVW